MELEPDDIQRLIQWFNAVEDLNHLYLEPEDRALSKRLKEALAKEKEHVVNSKVTGTLAVGDYVLTSVPLLAFLARRVVKRANEKAPPPEGSGARGRSPGDNGGSGAGDSSASGHVDYGRLDH